MSEAPPGTPDPSDEIIRDLKRKVAELEAEYLNASKDAMELAGKLNAAEADKARLSEALREIAYGESRIVVELVTIARAALSGSVSGWRECATEGCAHAATVRCARDGVESEYCHACYMRIWELPAAPQQGGE